MPVNNEIDYIIKHDTYNGWEYQCWSSGIVECWYTESHTATCNDTWGSGTHMIYYDYQNGAGAIGGIAYPAGLFKTKPYCRLTWTTNNSGDSWIGQHRDGDADYAPKAFVFRGTSGNSSGKIHYYAVGELGSFEP